MLRHTAFLPALLASLCLPSAALAWTPATQVVIAEEAAALAPPDLARQIAKHREALRRGALAPFSEAAAERHFRHADGSGALDRAAFAAVDAAIEAIRVFRPFEEVVYRLGVVSHYVADANHPLNATDDDPRESSYFADFAHYAAAAEPRFALVLYAGEPAVDGDREMRLAVYRALARGRKLYPLLGEEYQRIGYASGVGRFDDRSTAFGVAAVSFSHAVTDAARLYRFIWLAAGGIDARDQLWSHRGLVQLPRAVARDRQAAVPRPLDAGLAR